MADYIYLIIGIAVLLVGGLAGLVTSRSGGGGGHRPRRRRRSSTPEPRVGDDAETPRDTATRTIEDADLPTGTVVEEPAGPALETPESTAGRLVRLRQRLARSQSPLGRGLLALLSRDVIDEDTWEEIEDLLITADVGVTPTQELVARLRTRVKVEGVSQRHGARHPARGAGHARRPRPGPLAGRRPHDGKPAVVLMVGVNGTGKTTTVGKLARVLVAEDKQVVLGAADTFRAAAAEQLATWGERVGVPAVRGPEGSDPASVAFEAVRAGIEQEADVVLVDTAGRLQNKAGLMDELGKVKRVVEKQAPVTEVLLVLDATTGQNGLQQARVFSRGRRRHRHRADQAGRLRQGRHRGRRAARAGRPGEAGRPRRGRRRPGAVRPGGVRGRPAGRALGVVGRLNDPTEGPQARAMPRSVNSTSFSASSTGGIGRWVIARIARRPPSHCTALSTSMSRRTSPRAIARSNVAAGQVLPRSVEARCSAAIRSSRTDSAIDVRRKAAPSGVFTNVSTER